MKNKKRRKIYSDLFWMKEGKVKIEINTKKNTREYKFKKKTEWSRKGGGKYSLRDSEWKKKSENWKKFDDNEGKQE